MDVLGKLIENHPNPIKKCFFECFSKNNLHSTTQVQIFLTNNKICFSNLQKHCFFYITDNDYLVVVLIEDLDVLNNPPVGSYFYSFYNLFQPAVFEGKQSTITVLFNKDIFLSKLNEISIFGPIEISIGCTYSNDFSLSLKNNVVCMLQLNTTPETIHFSLSQKSGLMVVGTIKALNIVNLEQNCVVDLQRSRFDESGYSFSIPINTFIGGIIINSQMRELYDIFTTETSMAAFLEPVETKRQRFVREKITLPDYPHAMVEITDHSESSACGTCCAYVANVKFDCNHVYMCLSCTEKLRAQKYSNFLCPLCKKEINNVVIVDSWENDLVGSKQIEDLSSPSMFTIPCSSSSSSSIPSSSSSSSPSFSSSPSSSSSTEPLITKSYLRSSKKIKRQRLD